MFSLSAREVRGVGVRSDCDRYLLLLGVRLADKGSNGVANCRGQNTIVFGVLITAVV